MDTGKIRMIALKHALKNAAEYGKATANGVIGKVVAECPECKEDMRTAYIIINEAIDEVNAMAIEEIEKKMKEFQYGEKSEKTAEEKIRDKVPNPKQGLVTRLPPEPNAAALHIGHAKAMWLDRTIADLFHGKCILRWDDTNPEKERAEYVEEIKKDLVWLGIKWDEEVYSSDYMGLFYELCEKLLRKGSAYVCICEPDAIKENRAKKRACLCRANTAETNISLWKKMLDGEILPGKAVVRFKGDMQSENTTLRDPSLFRILDIENMPHFRQGKKYHVWPLYDFQSAVMDSPDTIGITHPLRSKEYELRNELYFMLIDALGISRPNLITISRLTIPGCPVSKRIIRPLVEEGIVWGWDDPRLVTIKGLARRGILPEAIRNFVLEFGISTAESNPDLEKLFAENRKIIDPISQRRMFVSDPVKMEIVGLEKTEVVLRNHPEKDMGERRVRVSDFVYVSKEDLKSLEDGEILRLKDFCNVKFEDNGLNPIFAFMGNAHLKDAKKIQWVPRNGIKCSVFIPERLFNEDETMNKYSLRIDEGLCEPSCLDLAKGAIVQFERYGFVRLDKVDKNNEEIHAIFCHK